MGVSALAVQQMVAQNNAAISMVKKNAEAEQALVNMIAQNSPSNGRGQIIDLTV